MNQDVMQQLVAEVKKLQKRVGYLERLEKATLLTDLGGAPKIGTLNYSGTAVTINDDSVYSFTPGRQIGVMLLYGRSAGYYGLHAIVSYRVLSTGYSLKILGHANVAVTTGALTGTTGVDGNVTVSASHADGKLYIENRYGSAISLGIVLLGE